MPPFNPYFTDNTTFINPLGLGFTVLMGLLLLVLPRRYATLPIMATICYMTMGMRFLVGGLNFTMIRILLIFCWGRLLVRGELRRITLTPVDHAVIWFTVASIVSHTFLLGSDGMKYKLGQSYDAIGYYFFFRILFREWEDFVSMFKATAFLLVPLAFEMVNEKLTLSNRFAVFGGVSPAVIVREGTVRGQGPFGHPILAGTFGATMVPFMVALWPQKQRLAAIVGIAAALVITVCAGSSGPLLALAFGFLALGMWLFRNYMRTLRWLIVLSLVVLHFSMKAPVWFLLARVSVFDASTGYHRAYLIDRCIVHFSDWWLYGTTGYGNWGYYLFDRTNHYICLATDGGLVTLALFFTLLTRGFRSVGVAVHEMERREDKRAAQLTWALGAVLVIHCASFISVTYFDQNMVSWYLLLALIASAQEVWENSSPEKKDSETAAPQALESEGTLDKWLAVKAMGSA